MSSPLSAKNLQKLIRWYQDETGILEFQWDDVTAWAEKKGIEMPVPSDAARDADQKIPKGCSVRTAK